MKNSIFMTMLVASVLMLSCAKTETETVGMLSSADGKIGVTFSVEPPLTKATVASEADMTVQSIQVFVFLGNNLDVYGSNTGNSLTIQCTPGQREIYVLANAPSLDKITTKSALLETASQLRNSSVKDCNSFEMIGCSTETLSLSNTDITIPIRHITSRVVVSSIKKQFKSAALEALEFKVVNIYLVNVAGDCTYGGEQAPTLWYNKLADCNEIPEIVKDKVDAVVTASKPHTVTHTFYAYPNPTEEDSDSDMWSPRYTRLVIETKLGDDTFYYPVSLPRIESNKSYNISEIKITRPGSTSPDKPVSYLDCSFTVSVEPWVDVSWTEGTTI